MIFYFYYELTKAKIEAALTGDITSHNHNTQIAQALSPYAKTADVNTKVAAAEAKIPTKLSQLQNDNSTVQDAAYVHTDQNFTAALKQKLEGLANYNDSALRSLISAAQAKADQAQANLDKLVSGDASTAIDTFNEIEAFLKGVTDTETLTGLLAQQKSEITADAAAKYQPKGSYAAANHNHDDRYPTKTGSGASGTWPVSVSGSAVKLASRGNLTALTGTNSGENGVNMYQVYNNGYPANYGNLLHVLGQGTSELLMAWSGTSGAVAHLYYRNRRDTSDANWSAWVTVLDSTNFSQYALPKNGKAADADKLGGKAASEYALKGEVPDTSQFVVDPNYVHTDNNFTNDEKEILSILGANVRLEFNVIINLTLTNYDNYEGEYEDLGAAVYVNGEQQKLIRTSEFSHYIYKFENPPSFHRNWPEPITVKLVVRYAAKSAIYNWSVYENYPTETTVKVTDSDVKITESELDFNSMSNIASNLSESEVEKYRLF